MHTEIIPTHRQSSVIILMYFHALLGVKYCCSYHAVIFGKTGNILSNDVSVAVIMQIKHSQVQIL